MNDYISRNKTIEAIYGYTVCTNPDKFQGNERFLEYMEDSNISSFGKWKWANGFNTALTQIAILLKK